jgi:hypothetical protein
VDTIDWFSRLVDKRDLRGIVLDYRSRKFKCFVSAAVIGQHNRSHVQFPTVYIIDRDGTIAARDLRGDELTSKVNELL